MNERMEECLRQAIQDSVESWLGTKASDLRLDIIMKHSSAVPDGRGFNRETLWRALEIATEEPG